MNLVYRYIFILLMLFGAGDLSALSCPSIDVPEELPQRFASSDVVFLAKLHEYGPIDKPILVSVEAIWKGSVSDKAMIHISSWEPIPFEDAPYMVFANSGPDGYHSTLGACFALALQAYEFRSGVSSTELMTGAFGEPIKPSWHASLIFTYLSYFMVLAVLVLISFGVSKLVSPYKAFKTVPSARDAAALRPLI